MSVVSSIVWQLPFDLFSEVKTKGLDGNIRENRQFLLKKCIIARPLIDPNQKFQKTCNLKLKFNPVQRLPTK